MVSRKERPIEQVEQIRKLMVVSNTDWFVANFMLPFLLLHRQRGIDVCAVTPDGPYRAKLEAAGLRWRGLALSRRRSLAGTLRAFASLRSAYQLEQPTVIHHATALPVVIGSWAARHAPRTAVINAIPGLGHYFADVSPSDRAARLLLRAAFRWAARRPRVAMVFQQESDRAAILGTGGSSATSSFLVPGWGIDLNVFSRQGQPLQPPIVLLPSRMLRTKGVEEFVAAARRCRNEIPARFVLAGAPDPGNPSSIPEEVLRQWDASGAVEWWGHRSDMPQVLSMSSIVVLPTRYGEGVPQCLIEASAMQIPIVASNIAGCRQVVEAGVNGVLVPPGDSDQLAEAVLELLRDPDERDRLGSNGRMLVSRKFAAEGIFANYIAIYRELGLEIPDLTSAVSAS